MKRWSAGRLTDFVRIFHGVHLPVIFQFDRSVNFLQGDFLKEKKRTGLFSSLENQGPTLSLEGMEESFNTIYV